jgi:hypothetical protein
MANLDRVRYPVGDFEIDPDATVSKRRAWLRQMAEMSDRLAAAVRGLDENQLGTPYGEAAGPQDKWSTTSRTPTSMASCGSSSPSPKTCPLIKTYEEALWAETTDARDAPVEVSLRLLAALHERWTLLLESLSEAQFGAAFSHPQRGLMSMDQALQLYAWHGIHHVVHVVGLRARQGW